MNKSAIVEGVAGLSKEERGECIGEILSELTVLEMAQLKSLLEDKWKVKASAAVATMAVAPAAEQAAAAEEATEFQLIFEGLSDEKKKISVIKEIRVLTSWSLKEASDSLKDVPKVLKEGVTKAEAEEWKKKLNEAGANVTIKGA